MRAASTPLMEDGDPLQSVMVLNPSHTSEVAFNFNSIFSIYSLIPSWLPSLLSLRSMMLPENGTSSQNVEPQGRQLGMHTFTLLKPQDLTTSSSCFIRLLRRKPLYRSHILPLNLDYNAWEESQQVRVCTDLQAINYQNLFFLCSGFILFVLYNTAIFARGTTLENTLGIF